MAAIPYPIAFGGGGESTIKDEMLDYMNYHSTVEHIRRASDAYDFKQDRHTGSTSKLQILSDHSRG